ncbi:MAG: SAM-dependent methyltransferase [Bacteroidetes bacterium]|nr:SAM-dependent methyltransferase [Bacteroidota bacterium]
MKPGILYLIPTPLGDPGEELVQFPGNKEIIESLEIFIVEELRTARRFLKKSGISRSIDALTFFELNEHTVQQESEHFLDPALAGKNIGLLSEAGLPCIADPGHTVVMLAHRKGIRVIPLVGPSSLMLALMASGMNGQQFVFHGYLPAKPNERVQALRSLEKDIHIHHRTQIFIEAPYRNQAMLDSIRNSCNGETRLCIAIDLTMETEYISTRPIAGWKNNLPDLHKRPAVFLLGE